MSNGPNISCFQIVKNFFSGNYPLNTKRKENPPKNPALQEIEKEQAVKKAEQELLDKRNRVNSRWNDVKSIFGFGEKLTKEEHIKLIKLESAQKRFTNNDDDKPDNSIFDVK